MLGGIGLVVGVANGFRKLDGAARIDPSYLLGFFVGSALVMGLFGLVIGVLIGVVVRRVRRA